MKIYGSLNNRIMESSKGPKPVVGMGATVTCYTDRHAATISWVSPSGKTLKVREDDVKRIDNNGMSECQTYEYTPNPNAPEITYRLGKHGWRSNRGGLVIGHRLHYHDFSF